jgi:hypothetical protein
MTTIDTAACVSIIMDFFNYLDVRRHGDAARLFARTGQWERGEQTLTGPDSVLKALEARPVDRTTTHVISNLRVEHADATAARLRFYLTAYEGVENVAALRIIGLRRCVDEFSLEDGVLKIRSKRSEAMLPIPMAGQ